LRQTLRQNMHNKSSAADDTSASVTDAADVNNSEVYVLVKASD